MKKLHLICNSHLDPVWQWDWDEGIAACLSTFRQAAKFCDEYDYIFCHGESILYEWIEKYDKELFQKICNLIKLGKWHIMGGWYIQPDCNIPSGESFVRQIKLGKTYFKEKFGVEPKVALNFDSFGHTIGLVQILKKTGYEGYLICRPEKHDQKEDIREFIWKSKDGSEIKGARAEDETIYCSFFGTALEDVKRKASHYEDLDTAIALWGVGNHGGINSKIDLENLDKLIKESEIEVLHSTPEKYFDDIKPKRVIEYSLEPKLKGSYSSMSRIKMTHLKLENMIDRTERIASIAHNNSLLKYDDSRFLEVEKACAAVEFHDVLSGTCCANGEESSLNKMNGALSNLYDLYNDSFFALIKDELKAVPFEYPIFIFNHQPYDRMALCEVEILVEKPLDSQTLEYQVNVKRDNEIIKSQCIKELGNINFDRRKRIAFITNLKALAITRVDFEVITVAKKPIEKIDDELVFEDNSKLVRINKNTGLIDSFIVDGKELVNGQIFEPNILDSTVNPWGHFLDRIDENPIPMKLSKCDKGVFKGYKNVRVTEHGDILTRVESLFEKENSNLRISYIIPKDLPYIDIDIDVFWNEQNKSLRLKFGTPKNSKVITQTAFMTEEIKRDGFDYPNGRFTSILDKDKGLTIYNDGSFDALLDEKNLYLLLLNGAAYCAHLVGEKPIIKEPDRFIDYIEQGKHHFSFRMAYDKVSELETKADEFLNKPYLLNAYPSGTKTKEYKTVLIDNLNVTLKAMFNYNNKTIIHILNNSENNEKAHVSIFDKLIDLSFGPYEVKALSFDKELTILDKLF